VERRGREKGEGRGERGRGEREVVRTVGGSVERRGRGEGEGRGEGRGEREVVRTHALIGGSFIPTDQVKPIHTIRTAAIRF
jgi:hypothetical protein